MDPRRPPSRGGAAANGGGLSYSTLFNLEVLPALSLSPSLYVRASVDGGFDARGSGGVGVGGAL